MIWSPVVPTRRIAREEGHDGDVGCPTVGLRTPDVAAAGIGPGQAEVRAGRRQRLQRRAADVGRDASQLPTAEEGG